MAKSKSLAQAGYQYRINIVDKNGQPITIPAEVGMYLADYAHGSDCHDAIRYGKRVAAQYGGELKNIRVHDANPWYDGGVSPFGVTVYGERPFGLN